MCKGRARGTRVQAERDVFRVISQKDLDGEPLDSVEKFLREMIHVDYGCGGPPSYSGWYPRMFYNSNDSGTKWDALVADVHTNVPADGVDEFRRGYNDPGCVLHQGVGGVDMMFIVVTRGGRSMVVAGPVLSH